MFHYSNKLTIIYWSAHINFTLHTLSCFIANDYMNCLCSTVVAVPTRRRDAVLRTRRGARPFCRRHSRVRTVQRWRNKNSREDAYHWRFVTTWRWWRHVKGRHWFTNSDHWNANVANGADTSVRPRADVGGAEEKNSNGIWGTSLCLRIIENNGRDMSYKRHMIADETVHNDLWRLKVFWTMWWSCLSRRNCHGN